MKDLFLGIAIGAAAGAMIASPKCKRLMGEMKRKLGSAGCGCGCEQSGKSEFGGTERPETGDAAE